ncbi:MAG: transporter [bacterium]
MAESIDAARAELNARLAVARDLRDRDQELDVLIRLAALALGTGQPGDALPILNEARTMALHGAGTPLLVGRLNYVRGQAQARTGGDPLPAFRAATERFRAAGSRVDELRARLRVVETLQGRQQVEAAITELTGMIADLTEWGGDRGLVDCLRHRASLHGLMARFDAAAADHDAAVAAAERLGDRALSLRVRLERRAIVPFADGDAERWESWQALIAEAKALGDAASAGEIQLQRAAEALRADDYDQGLLFAAAARQAALDATEPVLYLMAGLLTAEAREGRGDDAGVIEILLTCKATLERAFGRELAEPVITVLDSLEPRWGEARFAAALGRYRAWAAARRAAEAQA